MPILHTASAPPPPEGSPLLSPVDRVFEVMFGLIMALTFTGTLSVATADREEVRSMLIAALGCNIAWGLVDAVMHLMGAVVERGRALRMFRELRRTGDAGRSRDLIAEVLPPMIASALTAEQYDAIRDQLGRVPEPRAASLTGRDYRAAVAIFFLVFLATLPVALPFAFIHGAHHAVRVSNGIALTMLFLGGFRLGQYGGRHPVLTGAVALAVGAVLVWATIALGG